MILRIRSKDGNFRWDFAPDADASEFITKVLETTQNADPGSICVSNNPRVTGQEVKLASIAGRRLKDLGFNHGDLFFITYETLPTDTPQHIQPSDPTPKASVPAPSSSSQPAAAVQPWKSVKEDPVDTYWRDQDGKIPRGRDSRLCKHGTNAMCDHFMPLEPFDPTYHSDNSIKHLSFHAYLRKISPRSNTSTITPPPLTPLSYRVKNPCPNGGHAPWPAGICTACQPSAITLQPQPFRTVDHVEFSTPDLINTFLQAWRTTGTQRFGWLIGKYAPYDKVPMGIKAVVEAIHEPPQTNELDGLSIDLPWSDEEKITALANAAGGLQIVGTIFTDLTPDPDDRSKSLCKRHASSFFLSSLEATFAAHLQLQHPISTRSSSTGKYGSRLVTAVLSGTPEGGIDVAAYQVSEQACAMLEADMIEPSVEPGTMRVKEGDEGRYVPDVFYRFKNEYGLEVKQSAKPCFPVEYLLLNVTHGFPTVPSPLFLSTSFPVENRPGQDISKLFSALQRLRAPDLPSGTLAAEQKHEIVSYLSDWHLIVFISESGVFSERDVYLLADAVTSRDDAKLNQLISTDSWQTLMTIVQESAPQPRSTNQSSIPSGFPADGDIPPEILNESLASAGGAGVGHGMRTCPHCTFENDAGARDCDVCGLPLD